MSSTAAPHPTGGRLTALRAQLDAGTGALIGDLVDVRWLTGLEASNAAVLVTPDQAWLLTDFRYRSAAAPLTEAGAGLTLEIATAVTERGAELARAAGVERLLVAKDKTTLTDEAAIIDALEGAAELVPGRRLLADLRAVKTADEIAAIAAAQALADEAFVEVVLDRGIIGRTERDVAIDLEVAMRRRGAEAVSFPPIIAAGAHGALPHAHPRSVEIPPGELVVVDWGAQLDGYCSDCTRTVATGPIDEHRQEVHALVRAAQDAALPAIVPGAEGKAVDALARAVIDAAGHGDHFGHGLGHGVGLEVHEGPTLSPRSVGTLPAGSIVTVEPGVYLPGEFGVRVEELVVVGDAGPRILTGLPREAAVVS